MVGTLPHPEPPLEGVPDPLPPSAGGLSRRRRLVGLVACVLGLPALTGVLVMVRDEVSLDAVLLIYLLAVVVIAVVGGVGPSLVGAVASFLLANWFLTPPYYTFEVADRNHLIELLVFVVVAALVSVTVDLGARHRVSAERNRMEARLLSRLTSGDAGVSTATGVLDEVRGLFGMTSVALARQGSAGTVLASVGPRTTERPRLTVPAGEDLVLVAHGPELFAEDRRLLHTLATAAARAWDEQRLSEEAAHARRLEETDRVRAALLAAVGHDLRTPLAGVKAAVSSLRQTDLTWTPEEQSELLCAIEESADRLSDVISNLLAMSRIQAGALSVHLGRASLDEVVGAALLSVGRGDERVDVPEDLPAVLADAGLLERVLANLIANARRFAPPGSPASIDARRSGPDSVRLRIIDHGPGVPPERWDDMFQPFQTLGDRDSTAGLGMGLAIARGFTEAMGIALQPSQTPGGGLTMSLTLPVALPVAP
jgi:K+-sensing histidine kinase KdpD